MSKEFEAMEEAALKAYQEDLKRLGVDSEPPKAAEPQSKKPVKRTSAPKRGGGQDWVEGVNEDGYTYYYNTATGESQWNKPEGFQERSSSSEGTAAKEKSSGCPWIEAVSPEGFTYYYNTITGESRWEKPDEFTPDASGSSEPTVGLEESPSSESRSSSVADDLPEREEGTTQPEAPKKPQKVKISFRRKSPAEEKSKVLEECYDAEEEEIETQKEEEEEKGVEKEEEEEEEEEEKEKNSSPEIEESQVRKSNKPTPYGVWERIQQEEDPYEQVDLQLPQVEGQNTAASAPEVPPEPKIKFKERTITSLGDDTGEGVAFKKRKTENGKSRNLRQRGNDD
ncbi:WBP4 protein, partial [Amia calva]|nr:WBP4 protein [Amia calva]